MRRVAMLTHGVNVLVSGPQGGSGVVLLHDRDILEKAGWRVGVWGAVAKHGIPVEQIPVRFSAPRLASLEYSLRFVRRNAGAVLVSHDVPMVALLAPRRSIIIFNWYARLPRYWMLPGVARRFQRGTYVFPSESLRSAWRTEHPWIPESRTHLVWNGIDLSRFSPRTRTSAGYRVGFAGQWVADKGLGVLAAAWRRVHKELPQAELWLAGGPNLWQRTSPVPDGIVSVVKEVDSIKGLGVRVVGVIPRDQIPEFWSQVDVACFPSTWEEPFGLVAAEAMACGVPVVVTRSGALPEVAGDAGIVVPKADERALADALVSLLTSHELCLRLGQSARARAQLFALEKRASQLVRLVEAVADASDY